MKKDVDIVFEAVLHNHEAFLFAHDDIKNDVDIARKFV